MPPKKSVSFARGFKHRTIEESNLAIGPKDGDKWLVDEGNDFFHSVPKPKCRDDWLAQYAEPGQDYEDFLNECPWIGPDGEKVNDLFPDHKVYVAQIGDFESSSTTLAPDFEALQRFASLYYGIDVENLGLFRIEEDPSDKTFNLEPPNRISNERTVATKRRRPRPIKVKVRRHSNGRLQLNCPWLLKKLVPFIPKDGLCLIGLTMYDLYESEPDLFVAGLACGNDRVALFSFARYDPALTFSPELWYDISCTKGISTVTRRKDILLRCCRLLVHEIGHLLGLAHCVFYECCMNGSGHLEEDFRQPIFLCPVCLNKVKRLSKGNLGERYEKMKRFFIEHEMQDLATWTTRRIAAARHQSNS